MRPLVAYISSMLLWAGCTGDGSVEDDGKTLPAKVERLNPERIPAPDHSPQDLMGPGKAHKRRAAGSMTAKIHGEVMHFDTLPYGMNAAVVIPDKDIARVTLSGNAGEAPFPSLRLTLTPVDLGTIELPATLPAEPRRKNADQIAIRFMPAGGKVWETRPMDTVAGKNEVVLESFEGKTLRGTFRGVLHPKDGVSGDPISVEDGKFEIELRLRGVEAATASRP